MSQSFTYGAGSAFLSVTPGSAPATDPHTIVGWIYPTSTANFSEHVEINTTSGGVSVISTDGTSGEINWRMSNSTFSAFTDLKYNGALNAWRHAVGTYDGTTMRLYIDGVEHTTATPGYGTRTGNWAVCQLGPSDGTISDAVYYSAAISAADVKELYRRRLPMRRSNLEMHYPLFAGATAKLVDYSGKARTLSVNGAGSTDGTLQPPAAWGTAQPILFQDGGAVALGDVDADSVSAASASLMSELRALGAMSSASVSAAAATRLSKLLALGPVTGASRSASAASLMRELRALGAMSATTRSAAAFAELSGGTEAGSSSPATSIGNNFGRRHMTGRRHIR